MLRIEVDPLIKRTRGGKASSAIKELPQTSAPNLPCRCVAHSYSHNPIQHQRVCPGPWYRRGPRAGLVMLSAAARSATFPAAPSFRASWIQNVTDRPLRAIESYSTISLVQDTFSFGARSVYLKLAAGMRYRGMRPEYKYGSGAGPQVADKGMRNR